MTKKDYIAIAKAIKDNTYGGLSNTNGFMDKQGFLSDLVAYMRKDNPKFDAILFRRASHKAA